MGQLTLILGGARSGKSSFAQKLAQEHGQSVVYIATAEALDDEMAARIKAHKQERPPHWQTLEIPNHLGERLRQRSIAAEVVLLDCLTLLVSNLLLAASEEGRETKASQVEAAIRAELDALLTAVSDSRANWIIVSNEVGLGLVPPNPLGRVYRDALGKANQRLAAKADEVYFMVSGLALPLHRLADKTLQS